MITKDVGVIVGLLSIWVILMQLISHAYMVSVVRYNRRGRRRCHKPVAHNPQGYMALCSMPHNHTGHCAATLASLHRIGYTMPEF